MASAKELPSASKQRRSPGRRRSDSADTTYLNRGAQAQTGVTFRVRRLEPLVGWTFAAFALWVNMVLGATGLALWLIVLFAACIAGWSGMYPARRQAVMFARAALLVVAALLLQLSAGVGAALGPYTALLPLTMGFYLLLLATPWAIALVTLTLAAFAMAAWLTLSPLPWQAVLACAGGLLVIVPMALQNGNALRASDESAESSMRDDRTQLYNETGFFVHGAVLLAECRQRGRPFCMVLLNGADLLDVPGLLGRKVANDLFAQVVRGIAGVSGEGIAARTGEVEFALLLPGVAPERAASLVKQQLGDPPKVEVKLERKDGADPQPIAIVLDMAVAQADEKSENLEALYDALRARWTASRRNQAVAQQAALGKAPVAKAPVVKVPVLGPDDSRVLLDRRAASPTIPLDLRPQGRPWDT